MLPVRSNGIFTRYCPEKRKRPTGKTVISGSGSKTKGRMKLFHVNTVVRIVAETIAGLMRGTNILQTRYQSEAPSKYAASINSEGTPFRYEYKTTISKHAVIANEGNITDK